MANLAFFGVSEVLAVAEVLTVVVSQVVSAAFQTAPSGNAEEVQERRFSTADIWQRLAAAAIR
jgi:hypothetical protein